MRPCAGLDVDRCHCFEKTSDSASQVSFTGTATSQKRKPAWSCFHRHVADEILGGVKHFGQLRLVEGLEPEIPTTGYSILAEITVFVRVSNVSISCSNRFLTCCNF